MIFAVADILRVHGAPKCVCSRWLGVLLKTEKDFCHRKELSGTEKDLDMACHAIKTSVK